MLVSLMSARDVIEDSDSEAVTFDTCKKMGSPHRVTDLTRFTGFYLARILAPAIARLTRRGKKGKITVRNGNISRHVTNPISEEI